MADTKRDEQTKKPAEQSRPTGGGSTAASAASRRFGPLYLFRKAVLNDRQLQDRLRSVSGCTAVAEIANEYLKSHVKLGVSPEFERSTLRDSADLVFQNVFHISGDDVKAYLDANTNEEGEFLLGKDEMAMVAGSSRLADTNSCSYGSGCGICSCSSSLACVCK